MAQRLIDVQVQDPQSLQVANAAKCLLVERVIDIVKAQGSHMLWQTLEEGLVREQYPVPDSPCKVEQSEQVSL